VDLAVSKKLILKETQEIEPWIEDQRLAELHLGRHFSKSDRRCTIDIRPVLITTPVLYTAEPRS
jgi:hypothetical protein